MHRPPPTPKLFIRMNTLGMPKVRYQEGYLAGYQEALLDDIILMLSTSVQAEPSVL